MINRDNLSPQTFLSIRNDGQFASSAPHFRDSLEHSSAHEDSALVANGERVHRAETDGFKRRGDDPTHMSTATKVVLTTVAASALLSILLVFQNALA